MPMVCRAGEVMLCMLCQVSAMLVEMRITQVSGFDLSGLNRYRWNPGHEKIDLSRSVQLP